MGLLIGVGNTKPTFPYDYYYGIEWDSNVASSACTRIGRPELHVSLPIQSKMRRCILRDNGTVAYYLHANDSTKRDTGAAAKLDGTDGQVMVEIPAHYRKFEVDGTKFRCLLSEHALPGFHLVPLAYRSAYEAAVDRTVSATPKLASVVNTSEGVTPTRHTTEHIVRSWADRLRLSVLPTFGSMPGTGGMPARTGPVGIATFTRCKKLAGGFTPSNTLILIANSPITQNLRAKDINRAD